VSDYAVLGLPASDAALTLLIFVVLLASINKVLAPGDISFAGPDLSFQGTHRISTAHL
jgi:hypothetical protein